MPADKAGPSPLEVGQSQTGEINPFLFIHSGEPAGVVPEEDGLTFCKEPIIIKLVVVFMQPPLEYLYVEQPILIYSICVVVIDRSTKSINTPLKLN